MEKHLNGKYTRKLKQTLAFSSGVVIIVALMAVAVAVLIFFGTAWTWTFQDSTSDRSFEDGWVLEDGRSQRPDELEASSASGKNQLGDRIREAFSWSRSSGTSVTLKRNLPDGIQEGMALSFRSKNVSFDLSVGNEVRISYHPEDEMVFGDGNGSSYHSIPILTTDSGRQLTLTIYPAYRDLSSGIYDMVLDREGSFYQRTLHETFPRFIIGLVITVIGVMLLLTSIYLRLSRLDVSYFASISCLAFLSGVWCLIASGFLQLVYPRLELLNYIQYVVLLLVPYPLVSFANCLQMNPSRKTAIFACVMQTTVFLLSVISASMGGPDLHSLVILSHIECVAAVFIVLSLFFYGSRQRRLHKQTDHWDERLGRFAFLVFIICALLELFGFWMQGEVVVKDGRVLRFGIFFFIAMILISLIQRLRRQYQLVTQVERIERAAYVDQLTELQNRAAYTSMQDQLTRDVQNGVISEVLVAEIDLNNLKRANDLYGHDYGDHHISFAGKIINAAFGRIGHCYRIGGDEFAVFITGSNALEEYEQAYQVMKKLTAQYNERPDTREELAMACGTAIYGEHGESSMEDAVRKADREMYRNKRQMKKERGELEEDLQCDDRL